MQAPMPMVTLYEDPWMCGASVPEPEAGLQIQYAPVLVYRKRRPRSMEDFYLASGGRQAHAIRPPGRQYGEVATRDGGIATCDIPVSADLKQFNQDYLKLTEQVRESGESYELGEEYMVIGTSRPGGV